MAYFMCIFGGFDFGLFVASFISIIKDMEDDEDEK